MVGLRFQGGEERWKVGLLNMFPRWGRHHAEEVYDDYGE